MLGEFSFCYIYGNTRLRRHLHCISNAHLNGFWVGGFLVWVIGGGLGFFAICNEGVVFMGVVW
jgi:hypothetical protein